MIKTKQILFFVLLFYCRSIVQGFTLDLVVDSVKTINKGLDAVNEEIFRKTMVAKTIENVATLQKNFDESKRFYDEMRMIYNNPGLLTDTARDEFMRGLERTKRVAISNAELTYQKSYNKPGYIGRAFDQADNYVKTNLDFSDQARKLIQDKENTYEKIINDIPGKIPNDSQGKENALRKREEALLKNSLLQTDLLISLNKSMIETHRALVRLHQKLSDSDAREAERAAQWARELEQLRRDIRSGKAGRYESSEEVIKKLLR